MNDLALYFVIIAVSSVVFLPLHVLMVRAMAGRKLITTLILAIGLSTAAGVVVGWLGFAKEYSSPDAQLLACVAGGLTFAAYAGLYGLLGPSSVDRSVSAHIVELVYLAPGGRLKESELFELYTHEDVLEKRFRDCIETRIIERQGEMLVVTGRGARIAALYIFIGRFLNMRLWFFDRYYARRTAEASRPS